MHFGRMLATAWTSPVGPAVVVAILMAAPSVSAQSSTADRPVHGSCIAIATAAVRGVTGRAAVGVAGVSGLTRHLTRAGSPLRALAETVNLRPGKYEVIVEMSMPGGPVKIPPQNSIVCVDPKNFDKKPLPNPTGTECTVSDYQQAGDKATFIRTCKGSEGITTQRAEVIFAWESYNGVMETKHPSGRASTIKWTGKRIGECSP
jgi:hypothetical protein